MFMILLYFTQLGSTRQSSWTARCSEVMNSEVKTYFESSGTAKCCKLNIHCYKDYGGISYWVGDGFCDDINNNEACDYDDGDCCGLSMKKNFCVKCICKGKSNSF